MKRVGLWALRIGLIPILVLQVAIAAGLAVQYWRHGRDGVRAQIMHVWTGPGCTDGTGVGDPSHQAIRVALCAYENFARDCLLLVALTLIGFWAQKRLSVGGWPTRPT